jgi:hypothetical protein
MEGITISTNNANVIDRLKLERDDLKGKIERLKAFIDSHFDGVEFIGDIAGDCYEAQHKALDSQLSNMIGYYRALNWRIEILEKCHSVS